MNSTGFGAPSPAANDALLTWSFEKQVKAQELRSRPRDPEANRGRALEVGVLLDPRVDREMRRFRRGHVDRAPVLGRVLPRAQVPEPPVLVVEREEHHLVVSEVRCQAQAFDPARVHGHERGRKLLPAREREEHPPGSRRLLDEVGEEPKAEVRAMVLPLAFPETLPGRRRLLGGSVRRRAALPDLVRRIVREEENELLERVRQRREALVLGHDGEMPFFGVARRRERVAALAFEDRTRHAAPYGRQKPEEPRFELEADHVPLQGEPLYRDGLDGSRRAESLVAGVGHPYRRFDLGGRVARRQSGECREEKRRDGPKRPRLPLNPTHGARCPPGAGRRSWAWPDSSSGSRSHSPAARRGGRP